MAKLIPLFLAVSASVAAVLGHPSRSFSVLEKRDATNSTNNPCNVAYAPIANGAWPILDCVPFVQDPQVQTWLKLIDTTKIPSYPPSNNGLCPTNLATIPAAQCWWTCQKCTDPNDIVFCPTTGTWGLTYDDGPSPDSPRLYDYLAAHQQKATLFIVGSRAVSYPVTLQRAYNEGHQIAIHTWSHQEMTGLTNEQIVAELKWTEKAIFSIIGVTPLYWRPPYGDVDARVRNIATQLGYKTSIWTDGFDTNDWNIPAGSATPQSVIATFQTWLTKIPTMSTGFIVLEHDLFPQEVNVSITGILPIAYGDKSLVIEPIAKCIGDATPYKEGAGTFVIGAPANNQTTGIIGTGLPSSTGASTSASIGTSTATGTSKVGSTPTVIVQPSSALAITASNSLLIAGSSMIIAICSSFL
ncbi:chitin deacetylase [Entomortierella lignicola]|nr:chitin deacetylase [Entomortierella lignicola]